MLKLKNLRSRLLATGIILSVIPLLVMILIAFRENKNIMNFVAESNQKTAIRNLDVTVGSLLNLCRLQYQINPNELPARENLFRIFRNMRAGQSGYVWIVNLKGENRGRYVLSKDGQRDGENIWNCRDSQGNYFIREMSAKALALKGDDIAGEAYPWQNSEKFPRTKMARFVYFAPWDWMIGVGAYADEIYQTANQSDRLFKREKKNFIGIILLGALASLLTWLLFSKDIRDHERQIRREKNKAQQYLDMAEVMMLLLGPDRTIKMVNKKGLRLLGYLEEELIGRKWEYCVPRRLGEKIKRRMGELFSGKLPLPEHHDSLIVTRAGDEKLIRWHYALVPDQGGRKDLLAVGEDITERRQAEQILMRDKEAFEKLVQERSTELLEVQNALVNAKRLSDLGVLAASVAHELRSPLTVMMTAAFNIRKKAENHQLDIHLDNIEKKIMESNQIINNLLNYARIKMPQRVKVSIYDLLLECVNVAKESFPRQMVSVEERFESLRDKVIIADPVQLREIFNNILSNAFQAMTDRKGEIKVSGGQHQGESISLIFEDNGGGIAPESLRKVFDPFFTTRAKGTGLGLTICNELAKLHGGSIDISSEKGQGTRVTVVLPDNG